MLGFPVILNLETLAYSALRTGASVFRIWQLIR